MDNVLFYGDGQSRDEQRRQVRSAAAAYSHRHGPRKAKSGRNITPGGEPPLRRKPAPPPPRQKNAASSPPSSFASAASDTEHEHATTSPGARDEPLTRVFVAEAPPQSQTHTQTPTLVASNNDGTHMQRTSKSWEHAYTKFRVSGPTNVSQSAPAGQHHRGQDGPVPKQFATGENATPMSPSRMLPQYSWTEYPRYSMTAKGFQSPVLAQDNKQKPGFAQQDLPQSWHVEGDRPILPPLHKDHPADGPRPDSSDEMEMEFQQPLSQRSFLQFLDSTVHERALREARAGPPRTPG